MTVEINLPADAGESDIQDLVEQAESTDDLYDLHDFATRVAILTEQKIKEKEKDQ